MIFFKRFSILCKPQCLGHLCSLENYGSWTIGINTKTNKYNKTTTKVILWHLPHLIIASCGRLGVIFSEINSCEFLTPTISIVISVLILPRCVFPTAFCRIFTSQGLIGIDPFYDCVYNFYFCDSDFVAINGQLAAYTSTFNYGIKLFYSERYRVRRLDH